MAHQAASSLICELANNLGQDSSMSPVLLLQSEIVNGHWTRGCFRDVGIELLDRTAEETLRSQLLIMQAQLEKQQDVMASQDARIAAQDVLIAKQTDELKELPLLRAELKDLRAQLEDLRALVSELQKKV